MKILSTEGLTKLIQLVKSAFIKVEDVTETQEVTLADVATSGDYDDLINKPTIPSEVTESTISGWGFTKNTGTVTSVNNVQPVNGNVTLSIPDTSNLANKDLSNLSSTGNDKFQAPLVSGTNIKTINNTSILGSGNLTLDSLPSQTGQSGKFLTTDGTDASWANTTKVTIRDWSAA